MNTKFDELTKGLAQSVTRRAALKKFGIGLAGMALACFGLANKAEAGRCARYGEHCVTNGDCCNGYCITGGTNSFCGCTTHSECAGRPRGKNPDGFCVNGICQWPF